MVKKVVLIFCSCLIFVSCNFDRNDRIERQSSEEYQIISLLYTLLSENENIPPPFISGKAREDSLKILKRHQEIKDSINTVRQMVALSPFMEPVTLDTSNFANNKKMLVKELNSLIEKKPLNPSRIDFTKRDSITLFKKQHLRGFSADYKGINRLITFSRIALNAERTEAVVVATTGTSRMDTHTGIYFLKKENGNWRIEEVKTLSIS